MARRVLAFDLAGIEAPHFEGFGPDAFKFFEELAVQQNRDWFLAHKPRYEAEVRGPLGALVVDLSAALAEREIPLRGDPKTSLFRINRDVRFSNNKSLYKTNFSAVLTRSGTKADPGVLYLHFAPDGCFVAAGFYHPDPPLLARIRRTIAERPDTWRRVVAALDEAGLALDQDNRLVRSPKGFEAVDAPDLIDALKLKSFVVRRPVAREDVGGAGLVEQLADFAEQAAAIYKLA